MYAVRQIQPVENGQVTVNLPSDFPATNQVEIIILPAPKLKDETTSSAEQETLAVQQFLKMDISRLTSEQKNTYQQACIILRTGRKQNAPRILGVFSDLITVTADFDAPLPEDMLDLFSTSSTDEYGISLPQ